MKEKKLTWNNITYRQFQSINEALKLEDDMDRTIAVVQAIFGEDVIDLSLTEFNQLCGKLSFLSTAIPNDLTVKNITVNGREYYFDGLLGKISTAQYIDFQNYLNNEDTTKCYSVFIIPKGHKYNDGYDMEQVFKDILDVPVPILFSASFFFNRQFATFIKIFQRYSMKQLKKVKLPKEMKKNLETMVENSNNLVSYLLSQNFVK